MSNFSYSIVKSIIFIITSRYLISDVIFQEENRGNPLID